MNRKLEMYTIILIMILFFNSLTLLPFRVITDIFFEIALEAYYILPNWLLQIKYSIYQFYNDYHFIFNSRERDVLSYAYVILIIVLIIFLIRPAKYGFLILTGVKLSLFLLPFILIFEYILEFPLWWRCIDCSFGVIAFFIFYKIHLILKSLKTEL